MPKSPSIADAISTPSNASASPLNGNHSAQGSHSRFKSFLDMLVIGVIAGGLVALHFRLNQVDARVFFLERRSTLPNSRGADTEKHGSEPTCASKKANEHHSSSKTEQGRSFHHKPSVNALVQQEERPDHVDDDDEEEAESEEDENGAEEDIPKPARDEHGSAHLTTAGSYLTPK